MPLSTHTKVLVGWSIAVTLGISSFYLSKKSVINRRHEDMLVRERMRQSNAGEYELTLRKF